MNPVGMSAPGEAFSAPPKRKRNWGLTCGAVLAIAAGIVVMMVVAFVLFRSNQFRNQRSELRNYQEISLALQMYLADDDEKLPLSENWMDALVPFVPLGDVPFRSPNLSKANQGPNSFGIALNSQFAGQGIELARKQLDVPLIFDSSDLSWNATGNPSSSPQIGRFRYRRQWVNLGLDADFQLKFWPAPYQPSPIPVRGRFFR